MNSNLGKKYSGIIYKIQRHSLESEMESKKKIFQKFNLKVKISG